MPTTLRNVLEVIAFIVVVALIWIAVPAEADTVDCGGRSGIDHARCERHQQMAAQCEPMKGDAHFACDRDFLIARPLDCKALAGDDAARCRAEIAAVATCTPKTGRDFMRCLRDEIQASPMGAP